jgi:hypothetical protein
MHPLVPDAVPAEGNPLRRPDDSFVNAEIRDGGVEAQFGDAYVSWSGYDNPAAEAAERKYQRQMAARERMAARKASQAVA